MNSPTTSFDIDRLDFDKGDGLLPAIIQHWQSGAVLMLGYMSRDAVSQTLQSGKVTFWSRSKNRLWTKGETSGNFLLLKSIHADCDEDSILVHANPHGPTCHRGTASCFGDSSPPLAFLAELDALIEQRERERPHGSYTTNLFESGLQRIAQKVGEEGVETTLAAVTQDDDALIGEAADLVFHLMVLLRARKLDFSAVATALRSRHRR
jgi:phosphoribosyl-AMP cyclohydrolase / phosphoribosyl-ATP pyrophosphohydrolase